MLFNTLSFSHARREIIRRLWFSGLLLLIVILAGTAGYQYIEQWGVLDSLYMTVITVTTIGLGEVHPLQPAGRIFTIIISLAGVGTVAYALSSLASMVIGGELFNLVKGRQMEKDISKLQNHLILCGIGKSGLRTLEELLASRENVVVIDIDPQVCSQINKDHAYVICDDATQEATLYAAGILKAKGLITALPDDASNVFVTLTAREIAPDIFIVARSSDASIEKKLQHAGANRVIVVNDIGGRHMANIMLQPAAIRLVEEMTGLHNRDVSLSEISILPGCEWEGKTPVELQVRSRTGLTIVGIFQAGKLIIAPAANTIMQTGDTLIVFGPVETARAICRRFNTQTER